MRLVWTRRTSANRREIREYIALDNLAAALALDVLFVEKAGRLVGLGKPGRVAGTRERVTHQNYTIVYDTAGDLVHVLRVLHVARQRTPSRFGSYSH